MKQLMSLLLVLLMPVVVLADTPNTAAPKKSNVVLGDFHPEPPHSNPQPMPTPHGDFQPQPMPHNDFHPEPPHGDFHQGPHNDFHPDFHHDFYPQPTINPWVVMPIIANIATAPRYITNPLTGQPQLMTPGQWVLVNAGTTAQTYTWQPLTMWPLLSTKSPLATKRAVVLNPRHRFYHKLFRRNP